MLITVISTSSQDFIHYTQDNGLPSNKIYMVTVDKDGFIWCATDKGICMYNGDKFTIYTVQNGLPVNDLWKIYASNDGKLWYFGRSNRLGYIQNGIVHSFPIEDGLVINPTVYSFEGDKVDILAHFGCYSLLDGIWRKTGIKKEDVIRLEDLRKDDGKVFIAVSIKNNTILTVAENRIIHYDANFNFLNEVYYEGHPISFHNYSYGAILVEGTTFYLNLIDRLCVYNLKSKKLKTILLDHYFEKENIEKMVFSYENHQLVINGPAGKYYLENDSLIQTIERIRVPGGVENDFFRDNLDNTWISTLNDGVFMYPFYNNFKNLFPGKKVQKIEVINDTLYAGVENEGLYMITENVKKLPELNKNYFYELERTDENKLRVLTAGEIVIWDNDKYSNVILSDSFYAPVLKRNYFDYLPIAKFYFKDESSEYYTTNATFHERTPYRKTKIVISGVYQITKYKNRILLGTTTGIKMLSTDTLLGILHNKPYPINKLFLFNDYLMIGTGGVGLYVYKDTLVRVNGTENFIINNIFQNNDSTCWLSTNFGIHEIVLRDKSFHLKRSVLRSNGLASNIVNDMFVKGDTLYCATENGLCILDLKKIKLNNKPAIIFTNILINDSVFLESDTIKMTSKVDNSINVNFNIAYLNEHAQLKSYYKIEPIHTEWKFLNSSGFSYNGLGPGKYKVSIKTEGFNTNKNEKSFVLIIQPRWFETTWAIVTGVLLLIILVGFIVFAVFYSFSKKKNRRYKLENQIINLELYALRSKLNPHFIFNTFNSIQLYLNNNQLDLSEKYLILLSKHIRNVFEFSHLQKITLEKEINLLRDYLEIEKIRFGDKINIRIYLDSRMDIVKRQIPSMIIQPYVENSMVHGLFHKEGTGNLSVDFMYVDEDTYQVKIIDDGIGFVEVESDRISSTKVNKDRIELINQAGEFFITVDKAFFDENNKYKGTEITITITDGKQF